MQKCRFLAPLIGLLVAGAPAHALVATSGAIEQRLTMVTRPALAEAIQKASGYIAAHRGARVTIRLPAGTFDLSRDAGPGRPAIDVSGIDACPGLLTIAGAGMDHTTIIKSNDFTGISGHRTSCVTFTDITLKQERIETSQGRVVSASEALVIVDVPAGFPTPAQLTAPATSRDRTGRPRYWLKQYAFTPAGPQIMATQPHARWLTGTQVPGAPNRWRLDLVARRRGASYQSGDVIAIKAKSGGQAYRFVGGHDITFRSVRWVNDARGKFINVDRVTIAECVVTRPPPINGVPVLMATSGGGPHIGFHTEHTSGHLVENNVFEGLGDDPIAISHADAMVRNNRVVDATRGILLVGAPDVKLINNVLIRAPVRYKRGDRRGGRRARQSGKGNEDAS